MIYLELFLSFLKIGAVSFGGGYAMIPLVREEVLLHNWLTEEGFVNFIAVAESTPGPIAINMATFIGSSNAGFLGAICATLGVILPSFIIILLIASLLKNFLKLEGVQAVLKGIHPVITALIISTGLTMLLSALFSIKNIESTFSFDYKALVILALLVLASYLYKKLLKKKPSAIILIIISAILGIIFYSL
ncbi:MAG: chromate transporter [Clostridia bacterium]|nr:chromate transporter [Clostridia bacterium]